MSINGTGRMGTTELDTSGEEHKMKEPLLGSGSQRDGRQGAFDITQKDLW